MAVRIAQANPGRTTALLGAGVSVESGIPAAAPLLEAIVRSLVGDARFQDEIIASASGSRLGRDDFDYLRFEQLIEWVAEVFDRDLGLFAFLDDFHEPGRIQRTIAAAAEDGLRILTVNFDDLLEQAVLQETPHQPVTDDAHSPVRSSAPGEIPVIKLHGSRRWHPLTSAPGGAAPHASIESIAATNPGMVLNDQAMSTMQDRIDGRTLLVCGYSGSDDLDIVPALRACRPEHVIWLDWAPTPPRRIPSADFGRNGGPSWYRLVQGWKRLGVTIDALLGDPLESLGMLGFDVPPPNPMPTVDWRKALRGWARSVRWNDPTGLGFAGLVLGDLGLDELSLEALEESRPARRPGATWTSHRRSYEIAQGFFLRTPSDPATAYRVATRAQHQAERAGDTESQAYSEMLLGRAAPFLDPPDIERAQHHLESCLRLTDPGSRLWAFGAERLASLFARTGRDEAAVRYARQASSMLEAEGLLSDLLDSLVAEATALGHLGRWTQAADRLDHAELIAHRLGYSARRFEILQIRGSQAFNAERPEEAETHLLAAISFLGKDPHDELADVWDALGMLYREGGLHRKASAAFRRAIGAASPITGPSTATLWAELAETQLLAGQLHAATRSAAEAEASAGKTGIWPVAHAAAVRHCIAPTPANWSVLESALRGLPGPANRPERVQMGMSLARLATAVRGTRLVLYRAKQAADALGNDGRRIVIDAARLRLSGRS